MYGATFDLFEMLSGRKTFQGEDITLTLPLAAVVKDEPDWDLFPAEVGSLKQILVRCLWKVLSLNKMVTSLLMENG